MADQEGSAHAASAARTIAAFAVVEVAVGCAAGSVCFGAHRRRAEGRHGDRGCGRGWGEVGRDGLGPCGSLDAADRALDRRGVDRVGGTSFGTLNPGPDGKGGEFSMRKLLFAAMLATLTLLATAISVGADGGTICC